MLESLRRLVKPKYESLNRIEISAGNLLANYYYLRRLQPEAEIFPVLKSNAYGHGLKEVCQILNGSTAKMVAVDSYPEAQVAYRYFKGQVLILGEMPLKAYGYCRLKRTEFVVYNPETLKHLARFGRRAKVHLFINSGMNREGLQDLPGFIKKNKEYLDRVQVNGLCSHLASADSDSALNQMQAEKFLSALRSLRAAGFFPRWIHLGNSAAVFTLNNKELTAYRPGLSFYGYNPFSGQEGRADLTKKVAGLKPALEVYSRLVSLQDVAPGESVSYNETYRAARPTKIGIIPFGYFEGLNTHLSDQAQFLIESAGKKYWSRLAGRVCMNLSCLDLGGCGAQIGNQVQIVSSQPENPNSISNIAALSKVSAYEILVKFQANIRRKIV